jgi:hypothetical protein
MGNNLARPLTVGQIDRLERQVFAVRVLQHGDAPEAIADVSILITLGRNVLA